MKEPGLILLSSTRHARNFLVEQWKTNRANVYLAAAFASVFALALYVFFYFLFRAVMRLEDIGDILMDRLLAMFFLATFSMLVFSNLVVSLTSLYRSEDIEFLMSQPVRRASIFSAKYLESFFYSSWPFVYLSAPLFLAFGVARGFPLVFYLGSSAAFLMFLLLAASVGQFLTLVLAGLLPARRGLWIAMGVAMLFLVLMAFRVLGETMMIQAYRRLDFETILASLRIGGQPWLPSYWTSEAFLAASRSDTRDFLYRFGLLLAHVAFSWEILVRMAGTLYYRAWTRSREGLRKSSMSDDHRPFSSGIASLSVRFLPPRFRTMSAKDLLTFARDPWQWTQFAMLLGLLTIYLFNLRSTPLADFIPFWRTLVTYFNLGATAFIFSIVTTRFVYPLLSLEGGKAWMWAMASERRTDIVWQKFLLSWSLPFAFCFLLLVATSLLLDVPSRMLIIPAVTFVLLTLGLTSLAVGIGAIYPNFQTDNAAKIANGVGGIVTVAISLAYVLLAIMIEVVPAFLLASYGYAGRQTFVRWVVLGAVFLELVLHTVVICVPMRLALKKWARQEF